MESQCAMLNDDEYAQLLNGLLEYYPALASATPRGKVNLAGGPQGPGTISGLQKVNPDILPANWL